jgi:hypothetical protein
MPNSRSPSLPHFPSPRSPSCLSLCGQTPVLSTPRENCPATVQSRSFSCSVIFHPNSKLASHPLFSLSAPARPKSAKPITATCRVAYSMFLVSLVYIDQRCILGPRSCAVSFAATMDLLQSSHRSEIPYLTLLLHFHIPRTVPSLSASGNYGYLASLSPCAWSGICHISQLHGSHLQIPMYVCATLLQSASQSVPSIRHLRRASRATVRRLTCFPRTTYPMFAHIHRYHVASRTPEIPRYFSRSPVNIYTYQLPSFL